MATRPCAGRTCMDLRIGRTGGGDVRPARLVGGGRHDLDAGDLGARAADDGERALLLLAVADREVLADGLLPVVGVAEVRLDVEQRRVPGLGLDVLERGVDVQLLLDAAHHGLDVGDGVVGIALPERKRVDRAERVRVAPRAGAQVIEVRLELRPPLAGQLGTWLDAGRRPRHALGERHAGEFVALDRPPHGLVDASRRQPLVPPG